MRDERLMTSTASQCSSTSRHLPLGGIRHFIWDTSRGFALGTVNFMSWMTIFGSLTITGGIWFYIFKARGLL